MMCAWSNMSTSRRVQIAGVGQPVLSRAVQRSEIRSGATFFCAHSCIYNILSVGILSVGAQRTPAETTAQPGPVASARSESLVLK